ncbi:TMEM175 family protein [Micromonospora sp. WMMD1155]|uniref:TMEM175 family protein n=1 Tax=Micromonospora sp. WMMD1155 TaxID=3016094 RepID=UPI00249A351D|nr:TMEM175 family protein [Micromonospora sp. WMMD1155]WFE49439.1 TMEM175 family protein [Micromonospora sp. WMMD1155]
MRWNRASRGATTNGTTRTRSPIGAERDPRRVVAFSDAVTAIAITLLVLEIRPPRDTEHLMRGLLDLWPSYLAYGVTFLLIGQMWVNHHVMFDHIRSADRLLLLLNTLLLMVIAFLPFVSSVLARAFEEGPGKRTALVFYGIVYGTAAILFNVIWEYVSRRSPPTDVHHRRRHRQGDQQAVSTRPRLDRRRNRALRRSPDRRPDRGGCLHPLLLATDQG